MKLQLENGTLDIKFMDDDHLDGFDLYFNDNCSINVWNRDEPIDIPSKDFSILMFYPRHDLKKIHAAIGKILEETPECPQCLAEANRTRERDLRIVHNALTRYHVKLKSEHAAAHNTVENQRYRDRIQYIADQTRDQIATLQQ